MDDVVVGNEALAREGIVDDTVCGECASACIGDGTWHLERVRHCEGEDGKALSQLFVQFFAHGRFIVKEGSIGIGVKEVAHQVFTTEQNVCAVFHQIVCQRVL